jgi:hypothetical protein
MTIKVGHWDSKVKERDHLNLCNLEFEQIGKVSEIHCEDWSCHMTNILIE